MLLKCIKTICLVPILNFHDLYTILPSISMRNFERFPKVTCEVKKFNKY